MNTIEPSIKINRTYANKSFVTNTNNSFVVLGNAYESKLSLFCLAYQ